MLRQQLAEIFHSVPRAVGHSFFHYLSGNACSDFTHGVIYGGIMGLAVGLTLGIINYRQSMKRINGILKQIDEMKKEQ